MERPHSADFGSASCVGEEELFYVQSRWYRAPEVVLGIAYGPSIDVWSLACVAFEMLSRGKPLFPAKNEIALLGMVISYKGMPPDCGPREGMERALRRFPQFEDSIEDCARAVVGGRAWAHGQELDHLATMLDAMLQYGERRLTPRQVIEQCEMIEGFRVH